MVMNVRTLARRFERRWLRPWLRRCRGAMRRRDDDQRELGSRLERRLDDIESVLRELVGLQHLAADGHAAAGDAASVSPPTSRWSIDRPDAGP
jgi:hypothetical protein